jgi:hypothetical protein
MKKETRELMSWAKEQFEIMTERNFSWKTWDTNENCERMIEFLNKLQETEACLAKGGLVRDGKGNWLASGTRVKYIQHNADGDWHTGTVDFDITNLCWYLNTDSGDYLYLAKDYYEVDTFEKFDD